MRITVVGCSGSVPGPASPASCYLVEADDAQGRTWRIALDMGSGALGALQRYCDPRELDAVAISHLHPDHCADLAPLHVYLKHHPDGEQSVPVYGPFGTATRIDQLMGEDGRSSVLDTVVWQTGGSVSVGPMRVTCESVRHPVPAYALRIEGPSELPARSQAVLAYSGDTDVCDGLEVVASGADLFLCEATFVEASDAPEGLHLTARSAGTVAEHAGADRLVLTHVPPWTDPNTVKAEASQTYSGTLELAHAGLHLTV
jgi:ribonuclease BN (tRNA processing enzyme)